MLKQKDEEKKALERSKNELEAFIFDIQDKLAQDDYIKCSTEEQREIISKKCSEASDWLYEQGDDTPTKVYKSSTVFLLKKIFVASACYSFFATVKLHYINIS